MNSKVCSRTEGVWEREVGLAGSRGTRTKDLFFR